MDLRPLVMRAVVPRLAEKLRDRVPAPRSGAGMPAARTFEASEASDGTIDDLVDALLSGDLAGACRLVDIARACGRPLERIYLDLLAPAAAAVARLVERDSCSAAAGTLAFCGLRQLLHRHADDFHREGGIAGEGKRALLVPMRATGGGELSTFGLALAADFLRRAGWETWVEPSFRPASLLEAVGGHWFDAVEVLIDSAPAADEVGEVAECIRAIRRHGRNPGCLVVACGRAFAHDRALAARVGADRGAAEPLSGLASTNRFFDHVSHKQARRQRHLS